MHCKVIKKDYTLKIYDIWKGPALFSRLPPADAAEARVPNYAVVQHDGDDEEDNGDLAAPTKEEKNPDAIEKSASGSDLDVVTEKTAAPATPNLQRMEDALAHGDHQAQYRLLLRRAEIKHHALLRTKKGPLGWVSCFHNVFTGYSYLLTMSNRQCVLSTATPWVLDQSMSCTT